MNAIHVLRPTHILAGFLALLVSIGALAASNARAANSAESFVQSGIEQSYAILNDDSLSGSARQEQFRTLLRSIVDMRRVALFTLGPYARNASQGDLDAFERAFADFITVVYQRGLETYSSPKITGSTERSADDVIVNVSANSPNGRGTLGFRVRRTTGNAPLVTDMQVEGAWLAINQRSDFTAYLQQHNGDLGALSTELDKRTAQVRVALNESDIHRRQR
jgi:phospholipid transport system substrate-binding protein